MDCRDDHGKAKQLSEEPSRKRAYSSTEKGKGKMLDTNGNNYKQAKQQQNPAVSGVQCQGNSEPLIISSSSSMLQQQQTQRPLPAVNSSISSCRMAPPERQCTQQLSENNLNPNVVRESYQELANTGSRGPLHQSDVATVRGRGEILCEEYLSLRAWVQRTSYYWDIVKCSLILDGWTEEMTGRTYLNVIIDCPLGAVYLKSIDVTFAVNDVEAMMSVIERLFHESEFGLRPECVLQVIPFSASPWLDAVGERLKEKYPWMFWSVSATYCLSLMLERVASTITWVRQTITQAKMVTRLIYSDPRILDLLRKASNGEIDQNSNLVKPAKIKEATPFLTLENMLLWRKQLENMLMSREWNDSSFGSSLGGIRVAELVLRDRTFWTRISLSVKGTMPIVNLLGLINDGNIDVDKPQMGNLYERMDKMKEKIRGDIGIKNSNKFMPFWVIIDQIWNDMLHSPLHAAGYYLNPKLFYSNNFFADEEVKDGIRDTIQKIVADAQAQTAIMSQLDTYYDAEGDFKIGLFERHNVSPVVTLRRHALHDVVYIDAVEWWRRYGNQCKELQDFAIIVLGISCNGAPTPHKFGREDVGRLLSTSETDPSHLWLVQKCFVSYNRHLRELTTSGFKFNIEADEPHPVDDWIVGYY
ncbi:uncharacterized protein LOC110732839 [Chenopodium quinoa]|uniref:uncharacterized protein LOC110732839 n=1 Tax=Chenopodium quinoa TaxID=63459 RepID=UPI000B797928|nr:uncharacterized protein LOC110732839 [Chenopodium quinoa]